MVTASRSRASVAVWIAFVAGLVGAPAEAAPRCKLSVALVPKSAYIGQHVLYELRIVRREDLRGLRWRRQFVFPGFRLEWLPGRTADDPIEIDGASYLIFYERRALFPARTGKLSLPEATLECAGPTGSEIATAPETSIEIKPLPDAGRPSDFTGIVGQVGLATTVTPETVRLGESIRISIVAQGSANLWDAAPFTSTLERIPEVEVFEHPSETAEDAGQRLTVRRYFNYDLVPHSAGPLQLPELSIPWFNPKSTYYERSRAVLPTIEVLPAVAKNALLPEVEPDPEPEVTDESSPESGDTAIAAAAITLALLVAALLWWWRRRSRGGDEISQQLRLAERARRDGDLDAQAAATSAALRRALTGLVPEALALAGEELAERVPAGTTARRAAELVLRLESARFAGDGTALADILALADATDLVRALQRRAQRTA